MKTHTRNFFLAALVMAVALFTVTLTPAKAFIGISIGIAPPELPVYAQPDCPGDGYVWTPGYWAWDASNDDYYWVPGTWVIAPEIGFLWTPAWWGCDNGAYYFHSGYWGPRVGFYGGIAYGYGYNGRGYDGGYWRDRHFYYNRNVNNVNSRYAYSRAVENRQDRVSFNGPGGINARPTATEQAAAREHRIAATSAQTTHIRAAAADPGLRYSANHGNPAITATSRPGEFHAANSAAVTASRATAEQNAAVASRSNAEQRAVTAEPRRTTENALTGESRAATENNAAANQRAKQSVAATESQRAPAAAYHAPAAAYHAPAQAYHAPATAYHAPAYHAPAAYHSPAPAYRAPAVHAAAPRPAAPRAGGGGASHAAAPAAKGPAERR